MIFEHHYLTEEVIDIISVSLYEDSLRNFTLKPLIFPHKRNRFLFYLICSFSQICTFQGFFFVGAKNDLSHLVLKSRRIGCSALYLALLNVAKGTTMTRRRMSIVSCGPDCRPSTRGAASCPKTRCITQHQ